MVVRSSARAGAAEPAYQDPSDSLAQDSGPAWAGTIPTDVSKEHEGWRSMSQATRARTRPRLLHVTLNSDGRKHPVENSLAVFTLVAGLVTFVLGFVVSRHVIASWLGLVTLAVGLYTQLISATREQRIVIVAGLVAGFVGLMLAFAHGGLF